MDLKTGRVIRPLLENASEGVFTIFSDFTKARIWARVLKARDAKHSANEQLDTMHCTR